MRRLTSVLIISVFLVLICWPGAAFAVSEPAGLTAKESAIADEDIAACADDPAPGMDGRIPGIAGKPINLLSGAETISRVDLRAGNLYPIAVKRSYNSRSAYDSPLGY